MCKLSSATFFALSAYHLHDYLLPSFLYYNSLWLLKHLLSKDKNFISLLLILVNQYFLPEIDCKIRGETKILSILVQQFLWSAGDSEAGIWDVSDKEGEWKALGVKDTVTADADGLMK